MLRASVRRFGLGCKIWNSKTLGVPEVSVEDIFFRNQSVKCLATVHDRALHQQNRGASGVRRSSESVERLWFCKYATFFDPDIYKAAYRNLRYNAKGKKESKKKKKVTVDDDFSQSTIHRLIEQMKDRSFQFLPIATEAITTADGKPMPLGTLSSTDQVIQEAFRLILEPVFAKSLPGENSAQATLQRVRTWTGTTWLITANTTGLLNSLDHSLLGNIIMRGVKDQQLLDLYWKLVNAGLVSTDNLERHNLTGVSKGGILWPLFTNIYMSEFDAWIREFASSMSDPLPTRSKIGDEGVKVHYLRYGDQWVVGVDGPKSVAVKLRDEIRSHLNGNLKLKIEEDSIAISHLASTKVKFLGVLIGARDRKYCESLVGGRAERAYGRVVLEAPINEIVTKLVDQGFALNSKWPRGMSAWIYLEAEEILRRYTKIIQGLMEYYCIVDNKNMMRRVFWILRFSAVFTLCRKWRVSTRALFKKLANHPRYENLLKGKITSSTW